MNEKILDISWGTIFKIVLAALILYSLYLARDILILIVFSVIISVLFNPPIDFLARKRIPRVLAAVFVYLFIFGMAGMFIYLIAPIFVFEIQQFAQFIPQYFARVAPALEDLGFAVFQNFESFTQAIQGWLIRASSGIFSAVGAVFGGVLSAITVFSIAIFLSLDERGIGGALSLFFPKKYEANVKNIWERCQKQISGWFGTRVISSIFVALLVFIACKVLAIKYAVSFALLAGITNIVPIVGPIAAAVVIFLFTVLESWSKSFFMMATFFLIQQIEGNILTPFLTKKIIGMPPVLVLVALLLGGELWGFFGAILAIPLFGIMFTFLKEYLQTRREEKEKEKVLVL